MQILSLVTHIEVNLRTYFVIFKYMELGFVPEKSNILRTMVTLEVKFKTRRESGSYGKTKQNKRLHKRRVESGCIGL